MRRCGSRGGFDGGLFRTGPLDVILSGYQIAGMTRRMDEQISRQAPKTLTEALDASVRDLAAGRVGDPGAAQREARRILEAFEKARAVDGTHAKTECGAARRDHGHRFPGLSFGVMKDDKSLALRW
jgi:hypothetical protein